MLGRVVIGPRTLRARYDRFALITPLFQPEFGPVLYPGLHKSAFSSSSPPLKSPAFLGAITFFSSATCTPFSTKPRITPDLPFPYAPSFARSSRYACMIGSKRVSAFGFDIGQG